jgi:16S rRNA (cytosine1402-N4)-methyltransferase
MSNYHNPVLLQECMQGLNIQPCGKYVDVTFGGGGHTNEILTHLTTGKLLAFDRDTDALLNKPSNDNLTLVHQNYAQLQNWADFYDFNPIDGLLGDLGVSSHQFDTATRGFSFRFDAELDMRMNTTAGKTAADIINEYSPEELRRVFKEYGEIIHTNRLVDLINQARLQSRITTTTQLTALAMPMVFKPKQAQFFAQVFQALRIEVNNELDSLKQMLTSSLQLLKPGGRLVIMSYHSLEDRLVKNFMRTGNFAGDVNKDFFGNILTPFEQITRKPIEPSESEVQTNSRARSAKLRVAQKI